MTDATLDQSLPTDASAMPPPAPAPIPPSEAPPVAEQVQDDEGLDLLSVDGEDADGDETAAEGEEAGQPEEREPLAPWTPPEGTEISEHAKPHLEALDGIATDEAQRDKIIGLYDQMVQAQTARLAEISKAVKAELVTTLKAELGDGFTSFKREVDGAFQALPEELRTALRSARLPDGRPLMGLPEAVRMIHGLSAKPAPAPSAEHRRAEIQRELDEIEGAMNQDVANLYKPWKGTGQIATDRKLALLRELESPKPKPSAAALRNEEAELLALHATDPLVFEYRPNWKGSNQTGAQRLYELRRGRA